MDRHFCRFSKNYPSNLSYVFSRKVARKICSSLNFQCDFCRKYAKISTKLALFVGRTIITPHPTIRKIAVHAKQILERLRGRRFDRNRRRRPLRKQRRRAEIEKAILTDDGQRIHNCDHVIDRNPARKIISLRIWRIEATVALANTPLRSPLSSSIFGRLHKHVLNGFDVGAQRSDNVDRYSRQRLVRVRQRRDDERNHSFVNDSTRRVRLQQFFQ